MSIIIPWASNHNNHHHYHSNVWILFLLYSITLASFILCVICVCVCVHSDAWLAQKWQRQQQLQFYHQQQFTLDLRDHSTIWSMCVCNLEKIICDHVRVFVKCPLLKIYRNGPWFKLLYRTYITHIYTWSYRSKMVVIIICRWPYDHLRHRHTYTNNEQFLFIIKKISLKGFLLFITYLLLFESVWKIENEKRRNE